jgi:hypothetical protein
MDKTELEETRRQPDNDQRDRSRQAQMNAQIAASTPSDRQKTYILTLAKTVGMKVDIATIRDKASASRFIETLKVLSTRMHGHAGPRYDGDVRDKRIAFGMAAKLIFRKYLDRHKEFRRSEKFWNEVDEFYREYQRRQNTALEASASAHI